MVVIRLARTGAKKAPFYHIVAADKRAARDGRYIERLGYFNPMARGQAIRLEMQKERIEYWLGQGAQPSERVSKLLKDFAKGVTKGGISINEQKKIQADNAAKQQAAAEKRKAEEAAAALKAEEATAKAAKADTAKAEDTTEASADAAADKAE